MTKLVKELKGLKGPNNTTVFEGLVCSILEQQISLNVAFNLQKRITKRFGEVLELDGTKYYAFPTPQILANADLTDLRKCGLSQRKSEYIKDISTLINENKLDLEKYRNDRLSYNDPQTVINELIKLRGIGVWTVELTMLRSMQRFDVVPADDLGLNRFVAKHYFYGKKIFTVDVRATMDRFGSWKGLVAYYFLEADRLGLSFV